MFIVGAVAGVRSLLVNAPSAAGIAQFVPARASLVGAGGVYGVVHNHRLIAAEVAIDQPVHQPVSEGIQTL